MPISTPAMKGEVSSVRRSSTAPSVRFLRSSTALLCG